MTHTTTRQSTVKASRGVASDNPGQHVHPIKDGRRKKTTATVTTPVEPKAEKPIAEPSAKTRHLIDAIKVPFMAFMSETESWLASRDDLAPKFYKAFTAWQGETSGSFVAFVRLFDETVPLDRDGYRAHASYQAAVYLRRKAESGSTRASIPAEQRPASPLVALARLVATILPIVDTDGSIWEAFLKECRWTEEQGERLRLLGVREKPIHLAPQKIGAMKRRQHALAS